MSGFNGKREGNHQNARVLVSGASGFIASHCIRILLEQGYKVRGTVRSVSDSKKVSPLYQLAPSAKTDLELVEADLLKLECWTEAVKGCTYVLHLASPFPAADPADEQVLIKPAVEGTLNVLKACAATPGVKRVVLTSSYAAVAGQNDPDYDKVYTEKDWTVLQNVFAYQKSKTLAEQAAWKFVENLPTGSSKFELATINPTYVLGPICHGSVGTSQEVIGRLLRKEFPALPNVSLEVCDVRDVALAHVRAMTLPEAAGQRFIINTGSLWFKDVAVILDGEFRSQGYHVPLMVAPKCIASIASCFDKTLHILMPLWGKQLKLDNSKMRNILKIEPTPSEQTVVDMAYSMIDSGLVPKTAGYKPRPATKR